MDSVIKLIQITTAKDEYGVPRKTETEREVYAQTKGITRAEFYDAGRNGLKPSLEFDVFAADYEGETVVEYEGNRYAVYRVYESNSDYIELYVERQGGVNGNGQNPKP